MAEPVAFAVGTLIADIVVGTLITDIVVVVAVVLVQLELDHGLHHLPS